MERNITPSEAGAYGETTHEQHTLEYQSGHAQTVPLGMDADLGCDFTISFPKITYPLMYTIQTQLAD
jgi:hypothetical protein